MSDDIIIVSGLPRSGTSLMMQMLHRGGIEVVTDGEREFADPDNPRGYFELEAVKRVKQDASWIDSARGKAFKMISQLLFDLPPTEKYRVLLMHRDLDEVLTSQEKMLARLGRPAVPREKMAAAFRSHLERLGDWLTKQPHIAVLRIDYAKLIANPAAESAHINEFLGGSANASEMAAAVDPALYRNRKK